MWLNSPWCQILYAVSTTASFVLVLSMSFPLYVLFLPLFFATRIYGSINGFGFFFLGLEFSLEQIIYPCPDSWPA